ncbi:DUF202 domain-containing protein [Nocardia sp. NPDC058658]|uniref:DUF202 domain-containing protein n=1 Tax=Nocardia sp. NPDC058658 TaxID=3346580 RepID=UPI0036641999
MTVPSLAMERTALAWRRTSLAAAVCALLFVHEATTDSRRTVVLPLAAATVALLLACVGWLRGHALDRGHAGISDRPVATTTVAVAILAFIAVLSVLFNG